jgi:hypothetical protein
MKSRKCLQSHLQGSLMTTAQPPKWRNPVFISSPSRGGLRWGWGHLYKAVLPVKHREERLFLLRSVVQRFHGFDDTGGGGLQGFGELEDGDEGGLFETVISQ